MGYLFHLIPVLVQADHKVPVPTNTHSPFEKYTSNDFHHRRYFSLEFSQRQKSMNYYYSYEIRRQSIHNNHITQVGVVHSVIEEPSPNCPFSPVPQIRIFLLFVRHMACMPPAAMAMGVPSVGGVMISVGTQKPWLVERTPNWLEEFVPQEYIVI